MRGGTAVPVAGFFGVAGSTFSWLDFQEKTVVVDETGHRTEIRNVSMENIVDNGERGGRFTVVIR